MSKNRDLLQGCIIMAKEIWFSDNVTSIDPDDVLFTVNHIPACGAYKEYFMVTVDYQKDKGKVDAGPIQETPISLPISYQFKHHADDILLNVYENICQILNEIAS